MAPEDVTYVMPVWEQFQGTSVAGVQDEIAKLRSTIGPEGDYVKLGFTVYIFVNFDSWNVDPTDTAAVKAHLASTISQIDSALAKASAAGVPVTLSFLTQAREGYDGFQTGAEQADGRNTQWFGGGDKDKNNNPIVVDNTLSKGWMSLSRYARQYRTRYQAYARELGKVIAARMAAYPNTFVAAAGDGEVELSFDKSEIKNGTLFNGATNHLADYSPFAVMEFRDWLMGSGLYAAGQPFAGQAYVDASKYDTLAKVNAAFGTNFTNLNLKYFDWDPSNESASAILPTQYDGASWSTNRHPAGNADGFDAPRLRDWDSPWWQVWLEFRRQMVYRHNLDYAKWITQNAGSEIPSSKWYSYQIPADYLLQQTPTDANNVRYQTSASAWWTGDIAPYGRPGMTAFNIYSGPSFWPNANPVLQGVARTLSQVGPQVALRQRRFAILEWHPGVGKDSDFIDCSTPATCTAGTNIFTEEMKLVEQYRPALLAPYSLYNDEDQQPGKPYPTFPFYASTRYMAALKDMIAHLNEGPRSNPNPQLVLDLANNATVTLPFNVTGYAVDTGTIPGNGLGPGVEKVEVYSTRTNAAGVASAGETLLGRATYGSTRTDAGTLYGPQFADSGFLLAISSLVPGQYQLRVVSTSRNVKTPATKEQTINITVPGSPSLTVESPSAGSILQPFSLTGWTRDGGAQSGLGIDTVTITRTSGNTTSPVTTVTSFLPRTDLPQCTGQFANCGFSVPISGLAPGSYTFTLTAHSVVDGTSVTKTVNVTIPSAQPRLSIDTPARNATVGMTFTVNGWAVDTGAPSGTGVDSVTLYAFKRNNGSFEAPVSVTTTYGDPRPDVGGFFGTQFTNSGFVAALTLTQGSYVLRASAHTLVDNSTRDQDIDITVQGPVPDPAMSVDTPGAGAVLGRTFAVSGWAVDRGAPSGTGVDSVQVVAYAITNGVVASTPTSTTNATYGSSRGDVGGVFGSRFTDSGYSASITLPYGAFRLRTQARSTLTGTYNQFVDRDVTIPAPVSVPLLSIDSPPTGATRPQSFAISGWAVDKGASVPNGGTGVDYVHVWAFPLVNGVPQGSGTFVGAATYGATRFDVGNGSVFQKEVDVNVTAPTPLPLMSLDGPADGATVDQSGLGFKTGGWAIDLGATSGPGVDDIHVWAFPIVNGLPDGANGKFVAQGTIGGSRTDVGAVFGSQFNNSGYTFFIKGLPAGQHLLVVYARSTVSGTFNQDKRVLINVQ